MKELMATKPTSELTQNDVRSILQECMDSETSESQIYESLMILIRSFRESLQTYKQEEQLQKNIDVAKHISSLLRRNSQSTGNLRYYYFGIYHAKLEQIQDELLERRVSARQQEVASRKHFASIMRILYSQQMVQQSELSKQLSINRGNLSREMDRLILAGFVEERKAGKFKLYNLSAQGHSFYDKYLLLQSQFEPLQWDDLKKNNQLEYVSDGTIRYQESVTNVSPRSLSERIALIYLNTIPMGLDSIDYELIDLKTDMMEVR